MIVYLVDTDVISEARKGDRANAGVRTFFRSASRDATPLFLSAITVGELRQGTEIVRHRGDEPQAARLERWLDRITRDYADSILPFDEEIAHVWGRLRVPHPASPAWVRPALPPRSAGPAARAAARRARGRSASSRGRRSF